MTIDTDRIDDAVLALLYLTLHDQDRASKGLDRDALDRLHEKGMIESPAGIAESVTFTSVGLRRSKELSEAMFARRAAETPASAPVAAEQAVKYPGIRVGLADLGAEMYPILRRVSYALSDADIDDAEIELYKSEVKASGDPLGVSRRWVNVA